MTVGSRLSVVRGGGISFQFQFSVTKEHCGGKCRQLPYNLLTADN